MATKTTHYELNKPAANESPDVSLLNENSDIIDEELYARAKSVNGNTPNASGDIALNSIPLADNLSTDNVQSSSGTFLVRTTGGSSSITDGNAWLLRIIGNCVHTGQVRENVSYIVNLAERQDPEDAITVEVSQSEFAAYAETSGTYTFNYTSSWSPSISNTGIYVDGTPVSGDQIVVTYVKGNRGTILPARPVSFASTGWNLYDPGANGIYLPRYSETYGYKVGGSFTSVQFSLTRNGTKETLQVVPNTGLFWIPSDGYVWINGGNTTDTYLITTWSDWVDGPTVPWEAYSEDVISIETIMSSHFPNGLLSVGSVHDEIDLNTHRAYSRIGRTAYDPDQITALIASGKAYDADENYIYFEKDVVDDYTVSVDGDYSASEYGVERFSWSVDGSAPIRIESVYGANLKNKLERDVLTISGQSLNDDQMETARNNIGAVSREDVEEIIDSGTVDFSSLFITQSMFVDNVSIAANSATTTPTITPPTVEGYMPLAVVGYSFAKATSSPANTNWCMFYRLWYKAADNKVYMSIRNLKTDAAAKVKVNVYMLYVKTS